MEAGFGGDKKEGSSLLASPEQRFISWAVHKFPKWLHSYHLTLATIPICFGIILAGFLAQKDIGWLWLSSLLIALQWFTDSFDGSLGRMRKEGLVRWGYYMDHLLDYFFLCAVLIGYSLVLPDHFKYLHFFVLATFGAFMVNSFLVFGATNRFRVAHLGIGPTEIRIIFILINTLLITFGKTYLAPILPFILALSSLGLVFIIYRSQKEIWEIDMQTKAHVTTK